MLTPCGTGCEDAWLATASLIPLTRRIKFLVAFRPALLTPTLAAQMASTYQRLSGGRLLVNIVTGAEAAELARFGVHDDKETRYDQTGEFLEVMRGAWRGEPFDYSGRHYSVTGATTRAVPEPVPEIYFGGASAAAEQVAARHVDVYLAWGEPPAMVAERVERMRKLAAGRRPDAALRHPVPRDRPARRRRSLGLRRQAPRRHGPRRDRGRAAGLRRHRSPSGSGGWPSSTAATRSA